MIPATGKITLVGLGPGSLEDLTARARAAIAEADTVIGYVTYIRLVKDLLDGKEVIKKAMTEELDRAIEAYDRARLGKKVALISSGDAGEFGGGVEADRPAAFFGELEQRRFVGLEVDAGHGGHVGEAGAARGQRLSDGGFHRRQRRAAVAA